MDMDGNDLGAEGKFNNAGFTIHSGVYKARPDAMCVTHTHTRAGAGISMIADGIRPISQDALQVYDDLAYHPYGVPATVEECEALGRTCAQGSWDPFQPQPDIWARLAGRLYLTSLSILTLEVYYRYLPIYRSFDEDQEKPDKAMMKDKDDGKPK